MPRFLVSAVILLAPTVAFAHPGHGSLAATTAPHWLIDHPAVATLALVGIGLLWRLALRGNTSETERARRN